MLNRPDCFIAPHGLSLDGTTWLNVSAIDPGATSFCGTLLDMALRATGAEPETGDRSLQAARSRAVDRIDARRDLAAALASVPVQAYSQGLGAVLNAPVGGKAAIDLNWKLPVVELTGDSGEIWAVRVVFVPTRAPKLRRVVDVPLPCGRPEKRKRRKTKCCVRRRGQRKAVQAKRKRRAF